MGKEHFESAENNDVLDAEIQDKPRPGQNSAKNPATLTPIEQVEDLLSRKGMDRLVGGYQAALPLVNTDDIKVTESTLRKRWMPKLDEAFQDSDIKPRVQTGTTKAGSPRYQVTRLGVEVSKIYARLGDTDRRQLVLDIQELFLASLDDELEDEGEELEEEVIDLVFTGGLLQAPNTEDEELDDDKDHGLVLASKVGGFLGETEALLTQAMQNRGKQLGVRLSNALLEAMNQEIEQTLQTTVNSTGNGGKQSGSGGK